MIFSHKDKKEIEKKVVKKLLYWLDLIDKPNDKELEVTLNIRVI